MADGPHPHQPSTIDHQPSTLDHQSSALLQYEAVRLFLDRAKAASLAFALTEHNAPAVTLICQRLEGIPLALELAAVRVTALSLEQINERLANMLRLLTGGSR